MYPNFGFSANKATPRVLGYLRLEGQLIPLQPPLFLDIRAGIVPVNKAAQFYLTLQDSIIALCTLNDLTPLLTAIPYFQRFALIGPMVTEAVSLFDALESLQTIADRKRKSNSMFVPRFNTEQLSELARLRGYFGEDGKNVSPCRLLRNNIFAHKHPILVARHVSYADFREALSEIEYGNFFTLLDALELLANTVSDGLLERAIWGQCAGGLLAGFLVPKGLTPTKADLATAMDEMASFVKLAKAPSLMESVRYVSVCPRNPM